MFQKIGKMSNLKLYWDVMKIIGKYFLRIFTFLILVAAILFLYIDNLISFFN